MLKFPLHIILVLLIICFALAVNGQTLKLLVDDHLVPCKLPGQSKCIMVRENPKDPWQQLHGNIEGFNYEEGNHYELLVEKHSHKNSPDDSVHTHYVLKKILIRNKNDIADIFELDDAPWFVSKIISAQNNKINENSGAFIIFHIDENEISGNTGCNKFSGRITSNDSKINITKLNATHFDCRNSNKETESELLKVINESNSFEVKGKKLFLFHDKHLCMVMFRK